MIVEEEFQRKVFFRVQSVEGMDIDDDGGGSVLKKSSL